MNDQPGFPESPQPGTPGSPEWQATQPQLPSFPPTRAPEESTSLPMNAAGKTGIAVSATAAIIFGIVFIAVAIFIISSFVGAQNGDMNFGNITDTGDLNGRTCMLDEGSSAEEVSACLDQ